jgi:hypothetical protein
MDKAKLLRLRNDITRYLEKNDVNAKVMSLDGKINEFTAITVGKAFDDLEGKLAGLLRQPNPNDDTVAAIESLGERLEGLLKQPDNTEGITQAISNIRFPEVNFPDHISVDNFPPQKIPQPVTNIKSTLVADDTGLLQDIIDALGGASNADTIYEFGEQSVAAGNTLVLATYTVPALKVLSISGIFGEGIDNGLFKLYIDAVKVWQGRNAWTERNVQSYLVYEATAGQVVQLRVTNIVTATRVYSGGFYGRQIDA